MIKIMKDYVIGMDGGGTRTSVWIADTHHRILERFIKGSVNYNGGSKSLADENLKDILQTVEEKGYPKENCRAVGMGVAGIGNPHVKDYILGKIKELGFSCPVCLAGDEEAAFCGAFDTSLGMILISGTGSICFGKDGQGNTYRAGGFGHLIDDAGSGYAIGRDILKAVVRAYDGRREATLFTELVFSFLKIDNINELIAYVYKHNRTKKDIARLAPLIEEACEKKDKYAQEILKKNVCDLTDLVTPVAGHMRGDLPLAVSGSVLLNNRYIYEGFIKRMKGLHPNVSVFRAKNTAADGAVTMALELINGGN